MSSHLIRPVLHAVIALMELVDPGPLGVRSICDALEKSACSSQGYAADQIKSRSYWAYQILSPVLPAPDPEVIGLGSGDGQILSISQSLAVSIIEIRWWRLCNIELNGIAHDLAVHGNGLGIIILPVWSECR